MLPAPRNDAHGNAKDGPPGSASTSDLSGSRIMEPATDPASPTPKRRRIPKACSACRRSKVRCDEQRPCTRCVNSSLDCQYTERPPTADERIARLEDAISELQTRLEQNQAFTTTSQTTRTSSSTEAGSNATRLLPAGPTGISSFTLRERTRVDVVTSGIVSEAEARAWFDTFFAGCDRFVPVFDRTLDTFNSLRARSAILFDTLVAFGSRTACGVLSRTWRQNYGIVRQHTSELVLDISSGQCVWTMEDIQALLVIASYSESGAVLVDVALRAAVQAGLPTRLDQLFTSMVDLEHSHESDMTADPTLFWTSRVWYGIFVLDQILSLDGGKPPSVQLHASARRVRILLSHPQKNATDIRLFAQVELNALRTASYDALTRATSASQSITALQDVLTGAQVDLQLWLSEWQAIACSDNSVADERPLLLLNLRIQHVWAILTLHLRALTASGIENIALMSEGQRSIALAAKVAAEQHLKLMLSEPADGPSIISSLRFAMEFSWAKNSFCVLLVLRLAILLGDSAAALLEKLVDAKAFLRGLATVGMEANLSYMRILAQTIDKCERAVHASLQAVQARAAGGPVHSDFHSFIPQEFLFEWDFPGLNLCYIPLDWQDLFLDFSAAM